MQVACRNIAFVKPYWITLKAKSVATTWYYRGPGLNWFDRDTWVDSNGARPDRNNPIGPGDKYIFDTNPTASIYFNSPISSFDV